MPSENINAKIKKAQKKWADGIVNIGKYYLEKKDYIALTNNFIEELYSFKNNKILFKPTKASKKQFRSKKNEFISYFIGHNKVSDEDKGFAWVASVCRSYGVPYCCYCSFRLLWLF